MSKKSIIVVKERVIEIHGMIGSDENRISPGWDSNLWSQRCLDRKRLES
jgi:hypothetical protein